jgi:GNAT superfamily N-acetyltransferase
MIELRHLEPCNAHPLSHFTFPATRKYLLEPVRFQRFIVGAFDDDVPVGLAFGVGEPPGFQLISLFVTPLLRRQGIGRKLLAAVETHFVRLNYQRAWHFFTVPQDDHGAARFLLKCGWPKPVVRQVVCTADLAQARRVPWLTGIQMPHGYTIVRWQDAGEHERGEIRARLQRQPRSDPAAPSDLPDLLDPFICDEGFEAETSLALLDRTGVVGWLITHRFDDETLRVTCANIWPELRRGALLVPLMRELVERQARKTPFTRIIWATPVVMRDMMLFEHYRMRPWLSSLGYACVAVHDLTAY